jgi:hypothetical protein
MVASLSSNFASAENSKKLRHAVVIGNAAYANSPLENPKNDAKSISNLLIEADFHVSQYVDANQSTMIDARDKFITSLNVKSPSVALFYFAGHGVQINWKNYLIPVDAKIVNQKDVIKYGFDLNDFLASLSQFKNTVFIFILDSCRNNPFGNGFQPENKGLSQFDAPTNSLIAYSTSPGHVAADGNGANGLYTEKLLSELRVRGAKIEDALKKVRLNVRLASSGTQVPWESTSLEEDVYLFEKAKPSDYPEYLEKQLIIELDRWTSVKNSTRPEDWIDYIKDFPSGRFSEIAQFRLESLSGINKDKAINSNTAQVQKTHAESLAESVSLTLPNPSSNARTKLIDQNSIESRSEVNAANPFSSGRYPLARAFSVDDIADYLVTANSNGRNLSTYTMMVTDIDIDADRVWINGGYEILDLMGNYKLAKESGELWQTDGVFLDIPRQFIPAELYVGQSWKAVWRQPSRFEDREKLLFLMDVRVVSREMVDVPAGKFNAFRIEVSGDQDSMRRDGGKGFQIKRKQSIWIIPGVNFSIKEELTLSTLFGRTSQKRELRSLRQLMF